jgi:hypothetical protein
MNSPLDVKRNEDFDFAFHLSRLFRSQTSSSETEGAIQWDIEYYEQVESGW